MSLFYVFIVSVSLVLLITVMLYALRNREIPGSIAYVLQIVCVSIWSIGSLFEMLSKTEQAMLFWRNFEQIGVFLIPVACVYFAIDYAGYDRFKKYIPLLSILPVISILLVFTDSYTHLMRTGYTISHSELFGSALSVHQTLLGVLLVAYNYILVFLALIILWVFSREVSKSQRGQVLLVLCATALVFILAFIKTAFFEGTAVNLPIVTIYLPGGLVLFYNLYRNKFFRLSPVAREKVFDVIEIGIIVTQSNGIVADANPCAREIMQSCMNVATPLRGMDIREALHTYPEWVSLLERDAYDTLEIEVQNEDICYVEIRVYPLQSNSGRPIGAVSLLRDVTQLRKQELALRARAETDFLTSLLNRDSFLKEFDGMKSDANASGMPLSVLMMDLDKFKAINDTYGHDAGDRVLVSVAEVLRATLRQGDAIARIGGDEFAAVLPNVDKQEAALIADRIIQSASEHSTAVDAQNSIPLKLSIGICDNSEAISADEMLKRADKAMYAAKHSTD
jgi:diguanylate cyclase (GGDEF)-like protein